MCYECDHDCNSCGQECPFAKDVEDAKKAIESEKEE